MSTYTDLRDSIVAIMQGIPDIGMVHGKVRYAADMTRYLDLFKVTLGGTPQIRGWTVTRESMDVSPSSFTSASNEEIYNMIIRGMVGLSDALDTEATLQDLADEVVHTLNTHTDMGISTVVDYSPAAHIRLFEVRQFGSVLCHYCEIEFSVEVRRAVTFVAN